MPYIVIVVVITTATAVIKGKWVAKHKYTCGVME
jgi:hypothetical protein